MKKCSFCGRQITSKITVYEGIDGCICEDCAQLLEDTRKEYSKELTKAKFDGNIPKPTEIKAFLDDYVIGQDEAKERLAVAVYNHYKRINANMTDDVEIAKSNMIMLGETGCGKCISPNTYVTIRNKKTKEIMKISVQEFINRFIQ